MRGRDNTIKWLLSVSGTSKWYIFALILVQALHGASGVVYALFLRNIVDSAVNGQPAAFWRGILWIILLVAAQLLLRALIRGLTELSKSTIENAFKERLLDTLLHRDYLRVTAVHSGEWMNRLTNDTVVVANNSVEIIPGLTGMVVKLLSALGMIILLEPRFAAILIPGGLVLVFFTWLFRRILKLLHRDMQEADGRVRIFLQEHLGSLLMIRSFAAENQTLDGARDRMSEHRDVRMKRSRFSNLCNIGFGAAMNGMYLLGVGWCGYGIMTGTITFGTLTAITQLISQIQSPFANITGYLPKYYAMLASAERLREAEAFPGESEDPLPLEKVLSVYRNSLSSFGLRDVSFAYYPTGDYYSTGEYSTGEKEGGLSDIRGQQNGNFPAGTNAQNNDLPNCASDEKLYGMSMPNGKAPAVLQNVSLEIRKGEHIAFCGQSGCGKSTVLKLLMCVYQPASGKRYYQTTDGTEHDLTLADRRLFAYVPQGNVLMTGTVREVVCFAEPSAAMDETRLWRALSIACADEFVRNLENGPDTVLGERGMTLSEGQMQRLAIARAIFSGSPILLLDEVTSALDVNTEKRLLENMRSLPDQTVIIVTHRPAVLSVCDRVLTFGPGGSISE